MSTVNIREQKQDHSRIELVEDEQRQLTEKNVNADKRSVVSEKEKNNNIQNVSNIEGDSKEGWILFGTSQKNEVNDEGDKEMPLLMNEGKGKVATNQGKTGEECAKGREENKAESHNSTFFINDNEKRDSFLLPKPDDDGNFLSSSDNSNKVTETHMSRSSATFLSSKQGNASDRDMMQKVGVDLLMEKSAISGKITLPSDSPSIATDENLTVETPAEKFETKFDSHHHASEGTNANYFPSWVVIFLFVSNICWLLLIGRERNWRKVSTDAMIRLEEEIELLRRVYDEREQVAMDQVNSLKSALNQYNRAILPWEKPEKDSDGFVINNCWIQAQASLKLGECPQKYKEILSDYFGLEHWFEDDNAQDDPSSDDKQFTLSMVDEENMTVSASESSLFQALHSEELQKIWNRIRDIENSVR